ncbi:MAG TPA: pilin [Candidatus Saccharimonadales bacterium]|nr:pilin [Candidatus Saccharimonadales bacterium]
MLGLISAGLMLLTPVSPVLAKTTDSGGSSGAGTRKVDKGDEPLSLQPSASECDNSSNCCDGVKTSFNFGCKKGSGEVGKNPIFGLLLALINFLAVGVGIAVVIGLIIGGYKYMISNGNAGQVEDAKKTIANSLIALFLFAFMYALINFLVPGGVFK